MSKPSRKSRIRITRHAHSRAIDRDIDVKQIEAVMRNPTETIYDKERRNYKSFGIPAKPLIKEQPYLMIIHSKFNTTVTVITVMWKDKGGLRVHGFSKL